MFLFVSGLWQLCRKERSESEYVVLEFMLPLWLDMRELDAKFYLAHLVGCIAATLPPYDLIRKSWEIANLREEAGSGPTGSPLPSFLLCIYMGPISGRQRLFFSSFLCVWPVVLVFCFGGSVCILSSPWHMQASHGTPQVGHFLGRWALLLPDFPSLSGLMREG